MSPRALTTMKGERTPGTTPRFFGADVDGEIGDAGDAPCLLGAEVRVEGRRGVGRAEGAETLGTIPRKPASLGEPCTRLEVRACGECGRG